MDTPVDSPSRIDPLIAYKLRTKNKLTYQEIADQMGVSKQGIHACLARFSDLVHTQDEHEQYQQVKAQLMSTVEERLLASLMDEECLAKASLNNRAYALTAVHTALRLEEGKSSANIGIVTKIITSSDKSLFDK